ncbi:type II restriction endonuclease subunit R [Buttiauxella sp. 3AFRM03]|uniref:McrB family protein n=1 Tax=Buttiauxella sp. 3AFRM03 TaxID=2479367 RepID=UPI000EF7FF08|nr:AAA family ATPase [Buttiauxella sp. 3AFRM03]AYN27721.1 type II restriction endonuclease subunit R [Buttiauxella sp. 3AFRM03]
MYTKTIDELINDCSKLSSGMSISYSPIAPSFKFSNTGRRGIKYFSVTLPQLLSIFEDIRKNINAFENHTFYIEGEWRDLLSNYVTDNVVNALSTVQTLPLFALLNKVITICNGNVYNEKNISLDKDELDTAIEYLKNQTPNNEEYILNLLKNKNEISNNITAINKIIYGAPGTGKSYKVNEIIGSSKCIRTIFYPDMQYSDFVGCLKPTCYKDENDINHVTYEFRAGPFTRALIEAINLMGSGEHVYLVIEEINRASAPAVFGEIFQLLDRDDTGRSKYEIDVIDPDMLDYINSNIPNKIEKLIIPHNLSILATMNSSDQAVMPMDTAFKRRWHFEYLLIDYSNSTDGTIPIDISHENNSIQTINVSWKDLAQVINEELKLLKIPEDRLLGQRFVSSSELNSPELARSTLVSKVLVYLWDDVLRHGKKHYIFSTEEFNTFGDIYNAFIERKPIFNENIEEKLMSISLSK